MVPAQVADEHPEACAEIAARGRHEVGYHGYYHESVLELPIEEERELMKRGIARLEDTFDTTPRGNRSPPFALGPNTADLLEEFGFAYDSSLFGHDEPYRPRVPVVGGELRDFVELPVSWELDDAPYFLFSFFPYMSGLATPSQVLEIWKAEFDGSYTRRRLFPARRASVLHRPSPAHRHARRAARLHQELPERLVRHPSRGRRGVASQPGRAGDVGRAAHRARSAERPRLRAFACRTGVKVAGVV